MKQVVCFFQKKVFLIPSQLLSVVHITTGFFSFTHLKGVARFEIFVDRRFRSFSQQRPCVWKKGSFFLEVWIHSEIWTLSNLRIYIYIHIF